MFEFELKNKASLAYLDLESDKIDVESLKSRDSLHFIDFNDVKMGDRLTGSDHLYSARWQDNAVTVVKFNFNKSQRKELFRHEYLWGREYPTITRFFGYNIDEKQKEYRLVIEEVISRKRNLAKNLKLSFCVNMVQALSYLFKHQIFNFSVDINNVFFSPPDNEGKSRLLFLPLDLNLPTPSPVLEDGKKYSKHHHLFNLGFVLFELWTGAKLVKDKLSLPRFPSDMPNELKEIIISCWNANENVRPMLTDIAKRLQELKNKSMSYPKFNFSENNNHNDKTARYYAYSQVVKNL